MADPKEPKRPALPGSPGVPLPRLWKSAPDEEPDGDEETPKKGKARKAEPDSPAGSAPAKKAAKTGKARAKDAKKPGEKKGVLIEETPTYDTYETRQRVRIAVGSILTLVCLGTGYGIFKFATRDKMAVDEPTPTVSFSVPGSPASPPQRDDRESVVLLQRARDVAGNGKADLAIELLKSVVKKYPATPAAAQAREALDRPKQNLPLFLDRPAVVATSGAAAPGAAKADTPPTQVVAASKTEVASLTKADANLSLPVNPAEPLRGAVPPPAASTEAPSRPLPKGFRPRPGTAVHPSGWPAEVVGDRDGAPMVLVVGATFVQGRDDADPAEGPAHQVRLGTYYIDRHEVTVRQFDVYQKESGKRADRARAIQKDPAQPGDEGDDDRPAVMVSAREASDYSYWAGKRLPTEAQWEAAARTTDGRVYPWGPSPPDWSKPRKPRQIDPVMSFPNDVSPYGVFDLAGNAWEWTKDWYDPKYYRQFKSAPADNPAGPAVRPKSDQLVVKGTARDWVVTKREGVKPTAHLPYLGFRCVLTVEGPGNAFEATPSAAPPAAGTGSGGVPAGGAGVPF